MKEVKINDINEYQNPKLMIDEIEEVFNKNFLELQDIIMNSKIKLTREYIINYFNEILQGKYSDVLVRNSIRKKLKNKLSLASQEYSNSPTAKKYLDDYVLRKQEANYDNNIIRKYTLDSMTYDYYVKTIDILVKKSMLLLKIIEKICSKQTDEIKQLLSELDIELNKDGNIKYIDRYRLVTPTIYVIKNLFIELERANDINTYMTEKISDGAAPVFLDEMIPTKLNLQVKNLDYVDTNGEDGYIPLSLDQKEQLKKVDNYNLKKLVKMLGNDF